MSVAGCSKEYIHYCSSLISIIITLTDNLSSFVFTFQLYSDLLYSTLLYSSLIYSTLIYSTLLYLGKQLLALLAHDLTTEAAKNILRKNAFALMRLRR